MKKIEIKIEWGVNTSEGKETFGLEDVNCSTLEQWEDLSESQQWDCLQEALDNLPTRAFPVLDSWETISHKPSFSE